MRENAISNKFFGHKAEFQGVLTLWNIDTFEGGCSSKTSFLEDVSLKFEKQNKGAYIKVENLGIDEFLQRLKDNKMPDMFSFGLGAQKYLQDKMISLPNKVLTNVKSNFLSCGIDGENIKAVPWSYSLYTLISSLTRIEKAGKTYNNNLKELVLDLSYDKKYKKNTKHIYSLTFGGNEFANALNIFNREFDKNVINEVNLRNIDINYNKNTFYEAYVNFVNYQSSVLLGMENRCFLGKETDAIYEPLLSFTDLVNYISVLTKDSNKQNVCLDFVDFLLSENIQKEIKNIGLFSTTLNEIYKQGVMQRIERSLTEKMVVKNLF